MLSLEFTSFWIHNEFANAESFRDAAASRIVTTGNVSDVPLEAAVTASVFLVTKTPANAPMNATANSEAKRAKVRQQDETASAAEGSAAAGPSFVFALALPPSSSLVAAAAGTWDPPPPPP